ncbi:MAG: hypothetical protein WCG47_11160 [Dermatophilaceae bacterium]
MTIPDLIHTAHQLVSQLPFDNPPNPAPKAPPGVEQPVSTLLSYVKWTVLAVIIGGAFIGVGSIVGGKVASNHRSSHLGIQILAAAICSAILYTGIYGIVTLFT